MKRGQASVEITIFLTILLIIFAILFYQTLQYVDSSNSYSQNYAARDSLKDLSNGAKRVYLGGNQSFEQVSILVPNQINGSVVNGTVIGFTGSFKNQNSEQYLYDTQVFVAGSIPSSPGIYLINVTSNGSHVLFNYTQWN